MSGVDPSVELPTKAELTVPELNISSPALKAGAHHFGKYCDHESKVTNPFLSAPSSPFTAFVLSVWFSFDAKFNQTPPSDLVLCITAVQIQPFKVHIYRVTPSLFGVASFIPSPHITLYHTTPIYRYCTALNHSGWCGHCIEFKWIENKRKCS